LAPKIVRGTEVPGAGMQWKAPALIQMGDWCGACYSDTIWRRHNGCDIRLQRWMRCIFMLFTAGSRFGYWPRQA